MWNGVFGGLPRVGGEGGNVGKGKGFRAKGLATVFFFTLSRARKIEIAKKFPGKKKRGGGSVPLLHFPFLRFPGRETDHGAWSVFCRFSPFFTRCSFF